MLGKLSPKTAAAPAWSLWLLVFAFGLAATIVRQTPNSWFDVWFFAACTTGAVIAWRRPANPIGWLSLATGVLGALTTFAQQYAMRGLVDHPGSLPGAVYMAWLEQWSLWFAFPAGTASALLILFPTGRPAARFWQAVLWFGFAFAGPMVFGPGFQTMTDRVRALGGSLEVRSAPGAAVDGWIPARALEFG